MQEDLWFSILISVCVLRYMLKMNLKYCLAAADVAEIISNAKIKVCVVIVAK